MLILFVAVWPRQAAAQEPPSEPVRSPFAVNLAVDLPLFLGGAAVSLIPELFKGELGGPSCAPLCDAGRLNALDRTVVGNSSAGARVTSDALLGASIGLPLAFDLIDVLIHKDGGGDGMLGYGKDVLVLSEVLALNFLVNNMVKFAVRRPRPLTYDSTVDASDRNDPDAGLSFYSGHASTTFAMATSYSFLFTLKHRRSRLVIPVWIGTHLLAGTTAVLRVEAGKHFWTDVITGALAGSSVGLLCTYVHHRLASAPTGHYAIRLQPAPLAGGMSLSLVIAETR